MSVQVTPFAGTGVKGYADGSALVAAMFSGPSGLASDSLGNVFVADQANNRVRRIDWVTRQVTTVAGNGGLPMTADGLGMAASFDTPFYLAMSNGSLIVSTSGSLRLIGMTEAHLIMVE